MAKRRLTRRQQWRIKKIQSEKVKRSETRNAIAEAELQNQELGTEQPGLVITHFGTQLIVEALEGERCGQLIRCFFRANLESIVTGDQVIWCPIDEEQGVIVARRDRQSELSRPDATQQLKPIAANIDQIFVVIAPVPITPGNLIDRYLVAAKCLDIPALILVNKADLLEAGTHPELEGYLTLYQQIGYPCLTTSTRSETGLSALHAQLSGHTSVFVGQSGVGKTSLVNALLPEVNSRVGAVSDATGKGAHTTTNAYLYHLPQGGDIIDSPGIREFALLHLNEQEIKDGFIEFAPYLDQCKFRNCQHLHEPGCAVLAAVAQGKIDQRRLTSFYQLMANLNEASRF